MAFNSKYTGEQIEEGIKKSLEAMDFNGASVNVEIVDENTPASGTVTKEEGSNRARFDFKIPVPKAQYIPQNSVKELTTPGTYLLENVAEQLDITNGSFGGSIGILEIYGWDNYGYRKLLVEDQDSNFHIFCQSFTERDGIKRFFDWTHVTLPYPQ